MVAGARVSGRLRPPASKSQTQRFYNLALLAAGRSTVEGPLRSEDCANFLAGLRAIGCRVEERGECVEIEPAVYEAASFFPALGGGLMDDPRFTISFRDGRNHLHRATGAWDVIVSEPSNPWIAGIGTLFTVEAFQAARARLKPGGVFGVVDHAWDDPSNEDPLAANGYISKERTVALAEQAGFELVGESDLLRNPRDSKDYEAGVWTLPPSFALGDKDRDRYAAIGESDRMTLKFIKPE